MVDHVGLNYVVKGQDVWSNVPRLEVGTPRDAVLLPSKSRQSRPRYKYCMQIIKPGCDSNHDPSNNFTQ